MACERSSRRNRLGLRKGWWCLESKKKSLVQRVAKRVPCSLSSSPPRVENRKQHRAWVGLGWCPGPLTRWFHDSMMSLKRNEWSYGLGSSGSNSSLFRILIVWGMRGAELSDHMCPSSASPPATSASTSFMERN